MKYYKSNTDTPEGLSQNLDINNSQFVFEALKNSFPKWKTQSVEPFIYNSQLSYDALNGSSLTALYGKFVFSGTVDTTAIIYTYNADGELQQRNFTCPSLDGANTYEYTGLVHFIDAFEEVTNNNFAWSFVGFKIQQIADSTVASPLGGEGGQFVVAVSGSPGVATNLLATTPVFEINEGGSYYLLYSGQTTMQGSFLLPKLNVTFEEDFPAYTFEPNGDINNFAFLVAPYVFNTNFWKVEFEVRAVYDGETCNFLTVLP